MARENPPNTQDATQSQVSNLWTQTESQPVENIVWGRLFGKNIKLQTLDLCNEKFQAGRGETEDNDLILTLKELPEKMLCRISKVHFQIRRENGDISEPVYIHDFSRNGTFVNGELIGLNKCRILQSDDIIALSHAKCQAFLFKDYKLVDTEDLPREITSTYHISKKLGRGACGLVHLVYDRRTCIKYAMKHVKKDMLAAVSGVRYATDPEKVLNEAKIMKALVHPCVIKMHDFVNKRDSVYMVLEFMGGGDLLNRITAKKRLTDRVSKLFFYQMCQAVKYLHNKGITHRDLKPDNILLYSSDEETLLKVSDFGLSKLVHNNSVMRTLCGTPQYVAPEVLLTQGRGAYTKKVDIWSLGVVLYTCLSGCLPFHDNPVHTAIELIKKGKFTFNDPVWKTVPQRAKSLITDILTVNAEDRPSIDYVLNHSWVRDQSVILKAKSLMGLAQTADASDEENFMQPPQKRSKR